MLCEQHKKQHVSSQNFLLIFWNFSWISSWNFLEFFWKSENYCPSIVWTTQNISAIFSQFFWIFLLEFLDFSSFQSYVGDIGDYIFFFSKKSNSSKFLQILRWKYFLFSNRISNPNNKVFSVLQQSVNTNWHGSNLSISIAFNITHCSMEIWGHQSVAQRRVTDIIHDNLDMFYSAKVKYFNKHIHCKTSFALVQVTNFVGYT